MKRVAILGFGIEGKSLFSYFKKKSDLELTILDRDPKVKIPRGVKKVLGEKYLSDLQKFDLIFRSPGIPYNLASLSKFRGKISSLTSLFFTETAKNKNIKIIGVTGSAGKTTTATLIYRMLKSAGKRVFLSGNIGVSPLNYLKNIGRGGIVIMELSSFQLQDLNRSPDVALVLDIFEEHLDKHKNIREYLDAKSNITKHQKRSDAVIYFSENRYSSAIAEKSIGRKIPVTLRAAKEFSFELKIPGDHNYKNAMAAGEAAKLFGVGKKTIVKTANNFKGIEHRLEFVREIKGVCYYNNSKATNVGSAIGGIDAFSEKKVVLAGGYNKNLNLFPIVKRFLGRDIRHVVFFGRAAHEFEKLSRRIRFRNYSMAKGLRDAVGKAYRISREGDIVILSPGTASFDEFKNYEERGDKFKKWIHALR